MTALPANVPTRWQLEREICEEELHSYSTRAWPTIEPGKAFVDGWHIEGICEHLEAVTEGEIHKLVINIPPRHMKSSLVSVLWPSWWWTFDPSVQFLVASYAQQLSTRDAVKMRRLIRSDWYRRLWGDRYRLLGDQNAKVRYDNSEMGYRISTSVEGGATGEGGDVIIVDDPHKAKEAQSETKRNTVLEWWDETMSTRGNTEDARYVVVMQRLHEEDLSGHILAREAGFEHLMLPAEFEPSRKCYTSIGWEDPRTKESELLWPEQWGREFIDTLKAKLGAYGTAGQLQQRPAPADGGIWKRHWFEQRYSRIPLEFDEVIQSWDFSFGSQEADASWGVGTLWARRGANFYLLPYRARRKFEFPDALVAVERMSELWKEAYKKLVEKKANGAAVVQMLKSRIGGFIEISPTESKESRARAATPPFESGNVFLPTSQLAPWIDEYVEEMVAFPNGANDDYVDSTTQAINYWTGNGKTVWDNL